MPLKRKYESGHAKRLKKKKGDELAKSLVGSMDRYVTRKAQGLGETSVNDEPKEADENVDIEVNLEEHIDGENQTDANEVVDDHLGQNESEDDAENNDNVNAPNVTPVNIFDPRNWDSLDKNLIDLLVEKGHVRDLSIEHGPPDKFGRHFSSKFYTRFVGNGEKYDREWLVYSKELDKVFCFCCKLFKRGPMRGQLPNDGYNDWGHLGRRLKEHEMSNDHLVNASSWTDLRLRLQRLETIDKAFQDQIRLEKKHWRNVLKRVIAFVKFLAKHNLAFRGTNERLYQPNNGLFLGLVEMTTDFDEVMEEHCRRINSSEIHHHYLGHNIQNELLHMISVEIKAEIIKKIKDAQYFSVILDCTPDISHQEQMSLILRCVNVSTSPIQVEEFFLEFLNVHDTSGQGLFEELVAVIQSLDLDISNVRGQGYDNGSNMKGKHQGVQKKLLDVNPRAFYTPCGCHCLNLTLCDLAKSCEKALDFFGVLQRLYTLFAGSTKRWQILNDNVKGFTLKSLSTTRWESRIGSIKPLRFNAAEVREALLQLAESDKDPITKSGAKSIATNDLGDFEFLLSMVIWYEILFAFNKVSKMLQSQDMHISVAIGEVKGLIAWLDKFRETGFTDAIITTKEIAATLNVEPVFPVRRPIQRKRFFDESNSGSIPSSSGEESFRMHYFLYIVDQAKGSLKRRFEQYKYYDDIFGFLFTSEALNSLNDNDLRAACMNLENVLRLGESSDVDGEDMFREIKLLREILPKEKMIATDILNFLQERNSYPVVRLAYRILLTVPVTVASAERSFSKLKLLKSYLRSTMSQERLNGLAMISIENDFLGKINCDKLIDEFAAKKARRMIFK
uniref:zinc finger MYM-type protein 1-like n=1 Tax=Fragaria vesca subsp. vesca TaxID=101020 RepID=UPI0005CAB996|nr:PREDICTED: zinc finger MYM-type protein 1-like [Fragaria vesca subsp. vesca]